jgi:SNF2 family DNA or RNA helicase
LSAGPGKLSAQRTRVKPPDDVIKLQDRLFYVLQPPLETMLSCDAISMPLRPFPYQWQGIAFLYPRYSAILADEMGLGKTMQAITAIRLLLHAAEIRSVLLICPKPLMTNWVRELNLWAPEVSVTSIGGPQHRRAWQWTLPDVAVKIANYELLVRDRNLITPAGTSFDLVVLDEAQRIKNRSSTTSQIVRRITRRRSWALTGTPMENSPDDLVGLFEFLSPGYVSSGMSPRRLGRAVSDYVLRRTKDRVLSDLPPKLFRDAEVDLSPEQRRSYELAESEGVLRLTEMGEAVTIQHVFELVLRLKQICNFDPATSSSSKLERLTADLEEVAASGQKAIVFSQWVETLVQLRRSLQDFAPREYHGRIASRARDRVLAQFRDDPGAHVLLMSYGAGSVGLNLQFAQYVFLFDRWWNPAVEDQAINRAHRIGAAGPVTVSRFMTLNTIEERIDQILRQKREMFDMVLSQTNTPRAMGLSQQEIFGLFHLTVPAGAAA